MPIGAHAFRTIFRAFIHYFSSNITVKADFLNLVGLHYPPHFDFRYSKKPLVATKLSLIRVQGSKEATCFCREIAELEAIVVPGLSFFYFKIIRHSFTKSIQNSLGHDFFICWITSHFQEFQSAAIGKKIKIKIELDIEN